MSIVSIQDFTGRFFLSVNDYNSLRVQDIVDEYTKKILVNTIGIELYNDFLADFNSGGGIPTQERWLDFLNGKLLSPGNSSYKIEYEGCRSFLVPMIYGELMRNQLLTTDVGYVEAKTDGATKSTITQTKIKADSAYNEGICMRNRCIWFLIDNDEDYPDFELYLRSYNTRNIVQIKGLRS